MRDTVKDCLGYHKQVQQISLVKEFYDIVYMLV